MALAISNLLKTFFIGALAISAGETQVLPMQTVKTNAVAMPKFKGDLAQPGFVCPHLPWQDKFHRGNTGYIDVIRMKDLDQPIMCGIDEWNRPFIAFKYVCTRVQDAVSTVTRGAVTFFQRYPLSLTLGIFWIKKHLSLLDSNESIDKERKRLSADMVEVGKWLNRINSAIQANRTRISAEELKALNQAHSFGCSILQKVQKILKG